MQFHPFQETPHFLPFLVLFDLLGLVDSHVCLKHGQSTHRDFISWSQGKQVTLPLVKGQAVSGADLCMAVSSSPL